MNIPNRLPRLASGKQSPGSGAVCSEQAVAWLVSGRLDLDDETDHPECVQPVLNSLSIAVNDRLSDDDRHRMWPLILAQPGTARPEMEPVLSVRLVAWCAEQVIHLVPPGEWQVCRDAIMSAQAWCDNPCGTTAYNAANAAYAAYASAYAAYAAAAADADAAATNASASANAAYASASAVTAAYGSEALIALLSGAQAEHARLTGYVPSEVDTARIERLGELVGVVR